MLRPLATAAPLLLLAALACTPVAPPATTPTPAATSGASAAAFVVHDVRGGRTATLDAIVDAARDADVVFLGEQHDDDVAHDVQHRILDGLRERGARTVLAMEMFERDAQPLLDAYLAGRAPEQALLDGGRPWPNYAPHYRPLVELARAAGWPVVASNVPRPIASAVSRAGLAALDTLPPAQRAHAAGDVRCPDDAYRRKFVALMGGGPHGAGHGASGDAAAAGLERYYQAQCLKDETMAESIVAALAAGPHRPVVHVNGSFHSDAGLGVPARVRRRLPNARLLVVSLVRVPDPATANVAEHASLGDFVVLTRAVR